jgi:hypothetical protein
MVLFPCLPLPQDSHELCEERGGLATSGCSFLQLPFQFLAHKLNNVLFFFFLIHMCIQCLGHFSHLPLPTQ